MDDMKSLTVGLIILAFIVGAGTGYLLSTQDTTTAGTCPAEITSLDALTVALHDSEVVELLEDKSISTIAFSRGPCSERNMNYTQIVFRPLDPDPDDHMTASMIIVQVNDSCMVYAVYETYPSYIPEVLPEA
ncbi:MAG: hypothetical protein CVV31_03570 [Methanomicrobiales archaeon HGW-Methanomicrobiales-2]|jgi:hypothetical protein|nr:MAG: hypothetical protein CVV31_03570 [Methanomicrobiales archaeon HGW-Methanomicrobiales-2]